MHELTFQKVALLHREPNAVLQNICETNIWHLAHFQAPAQATYTGMNKEAGESGTSRRDW